VKDLELEFNKKNTSLTEREAELKTKLSKLEDLEKKCMEMEAKSQEKEAQQKKLLEEQEKVKNNTIVFNTLVLKGSRISEDDLNSATAKLIEDCAKLKIDLKVGRVNSVEELEGKKARCVMYIDIVIGRPLLGSTKDLMTNLLFKSEAGGNVFHVFVHKQPFTESMSFFNLPPNYNSGIHLLGDEAQRSIYHINLYTTTDKHEDSNLTRDILSLLPQQLRRSKA